MPVDHSKHLARADQHIARAHQHIARQRGTITKLTAKGHDIECAERLLEAMEQSLVAFEAHRGLIVEHMNGETTVATN
jgi:hypothetical protein